MVKNTDSELSEGLIDEKKTKLLFVCTNNLNCSPTAVALLNFYAPTTYPLETLESAGPYAGTTPRGADQRMLQLAPNAVKEILLRHQTKELTKFHISGAQKIVVMDEDSAWAVERFLNDNKLDVKYVRFRSLFLDETIYEVPEPTSGLGSFEEAFKLIDRGIKNLIKIN